MNKKGELWQLLHWLNLGPMQIIVGGHCFMWRTLKAYTSYCTLRIAQKDYPLRLGQCRRKCRSDIFNKILFITAYHVKIDFNCNCNIFSYNAIERYIAMTIKLLALSGMQLYTDLRSGDIQEKHLCHRIKPWFPFFCFQNIFQSIYTINYQQWKHIAEPEIAAYSNFE